MSRLGLMKNEKEVFNNKDLGVHPNAVIHLHLVWKQRICTSQIKILHLSSQSLQYPPSCFFSLMFSSVNSSFIREQLCALNKSFTASRINNSYYQSCCFSIREDSLCSDLKVQSVICKTCLTETRMLCS